MSLRSRMGELQPQCRIDDIRQEILEHSTEHASNLLRFLEDFELFLSIARGTSQLSMEADGATQREAFTLHLISLGYAKVTANERNKSLEELRADVTNLGELRRNIRHRQFINGLNRWALECRGETIKVVCPDQVAITAYWGDATDSRREHLLHSFWIAVILTGCRPGNFLAAADSRRGTEAFRVTWGLRKGGRHGGTYDYPYAWSQMTGSEIPLTLKLNGLPKALNDAEITVKDLNLYLARHARPTSGVARARLSTLLRGFVMEGSLNVASFELLLDHELKVSGQFYDAIESVAPVRKVRMQADKVHRVE